MKKYLPILKNTKLFAGVIEKEVELMFSCLNARLCSYKKDEYVLRQGEHVNQIGVLVDGSLNVQNEDYWGNRSIIRQISIGDMFGESFISPDSGALLNDVVATSNSAVIFFDANRVITTCPSSCRFHAAVVQNMFFHISQENKKLVQKISHMSKRSTREKLLSYLSEEAKRQSSSSFFIPFNRQELADFLSVDRSAMSNELSKMRDDGISL